MKLEITSEIYWILYKELKPRLSVFSSQTDLHGEFVWNSYRPAIDTVWAIDGKDAPLLECNSTKESREQANWDSKYYIHIADPLPND